MSNSSSIPYTCHEEYLHGLTHGLGVLMSLFAAVVLLDKASESGSASHYISYTIYCGSLLALYSASTCYHLIPHRHVWWKALLKKLDHICIYLLIAGTYTPFLLINFRNTTGLILAAIVWSLACLGVLYKAFTKSKKITVSLITYIGMGWLAFFARESFIENVPPSELTGS